MERENSLKVQMKKKKIVKFYFLNIRTINTYQKKIHHINK